MHGAANVGPAAFGLGRRHRAVGHWRPSCRRRCRVAAPDRGDARPGARALGDPRLDLVRARRARAGGLRGRQRRPGHHRPAGAGRGADVAQHRLGRLGQRRRGPDHGDAARSTPDEGPGGVPARARRAPAGPQLVVAVGDLERPARVLGPAGPTVPKPSAGRSSPAQPGDRVRRAAHGDRDARWPRSGRRSSASRRSASTTASSTSADTRCSPCRSRRRSATRSRSRCRCCSCSRRRPSPSWRC